MKYKAKEACIFLMLCTSVFTTVSVQAQDTLHLDLPRSEALFIKNNIQLLAQQYSIDSAKANIITAKLYDNPQFAFATGFYQPDTKKIFDFSGSGGEVALQLSQLIKTAGKRNKAIQVARSGVAITEYQFYDILRTLRYILRNDFYNIYYLQQSQKVYNIEIQSLQKTSAAYEEQVPKGNIAQKELMRIKSQLYTLQAELANLQGTVDNVQSEFKLLLRAKANAYIIPDIKINEDQKSIVANITYQALVDSAYQNRYDLKMVKTSLLLNQQNLALQKALAVPDLTINAGYDRLGSYVKNFNSIGAGVSIPLFNRNQGNIRQAQAVIKSSELQVSGVEDAIESQIANSYIGALRAEKLLNSFDPGFEKDFDNLIREVTKNYEKRNMTLLEFIDFYESYKQNVLQLNNLRYNRISQLEQLNFTTGTPFFNK